MIDDKFKDKVRSSWITASEQLKFEIKTPFNILLNGKEKTAFAFLPKYGSKNGMIVELTTEPDFSTDKDIIEWAKLNECYYSFINVKSYSAYDEKIFTETLEDWSTEKNSASS